MASEGQEAYEGFWPRITQEVEAMTAADFKHQDLPLARIKRVMKLDEDVRMISAEAPALFARCTPHCALPGGVQPSPSATRNIFR